MWRRREVAPVQELAVARDVERSHLVFVSVLLLCRRCGVDRSKYCLVLSSRHKKDKNKAWEEEVRRTNKVYLLTCVAVLGIAGLH
jgi:hypothetical protein